MVVTGRDVARLAGVSQPTVSRALRDSSQVSEVTRRRVRTAAAALGYVPSETGRALSSGRTRRVGLLLTDLENQFYPHVIAPIHRELEALDYQLVLQTESSDTAQVADRLIGNSLDGVLLATSTVDSILPVRLRDRGVPFVYFNRTSDSVEADSAEVDASIGLQQLAHRILELGHRRVAAIFGPRNTSTAEHRESALRDALAVDSVAISRALSYRGPFEMETGYAGARRVLERDEPPTVIVCGSDVVAYGALNAAHDLGLTVPGDVSVAGFDDLPAARWPVLQLTTVAFDLDAMARCAAGLLVARIESGVGPPYRHEQFPSRLVERRTLGPAP